MTRFSLFCQMQWTHHLPNILFRMFSKWSKNWKNSTLNTLNTLQLMYQLSTFYHICFISIPTIYISFCWSWRHHYSCLKTWMCISLGKGWFPTLPHHRIWENYCRCSYHLIYIHISISPVVPKKVLKNLIKDHALYLVVWSLYSL